MEETQRSEHLVIGCHIQTLGGGLALIHSGCVSVGFLAAAFTQLPYCDDEFPGQNVSNMADFWVEASFWILLTYRLQFNMTTKFH